MAVANGYGKVVTSGSVFMYDTGDTINSYMGEPTTNLINPNAPNIYTWWSRSIQTITQLSETYKGNPIYRISISIDDGDMLYHINARWGAGSGWYMPSTTYYANTSYVASVIYRPVSHADTRVYGHPSNISGWGLTVDDSIDLAGGWKQDRIDRNYGTTVGDNRFHHMHTPSAIIGQTVTIDITNSQIEAKAHATPFVNGTRSATQGLLPVIGNSTIDLTNVSFDSNAQMTFDGTNDYIPLSPSIIPTTAITVELIYRNDNSGASTSILAGGAGQQDLNIHLPWSDTNVYWDAGRPFNRIYKATTNAERTGIHHWVFTKDSTTGIMNIYLDGNLWKTEGGLTSTIPSLWSVSLGCYDAGSGRNYFTTGILPVAKIYNRALSAAEVQQNYSKYKSRFNLS